MISDMIEPKMLRAIVNLDLTFLINVSDKIDPEHGYNKFYDSEYYQDFVRELLYLLAMQDDYDLNLFSALSGTWATWKDNPAFEKWVATIFCKLVTSANDDQWYSIVFKCSILNLNSLR